MFSIARVSRWRSDKNSKFYSIINSESSTLDFLQKYESMPNISNINNLPNCIKYSSDTKMYVRKKILASGETRVINSTYKVGRYIKE